MQMPGRNASTGDYRYGFQGQETDDEVTNSESHVSYKYRMHDARLGRFLSIDPLASKYPYNSPYAFSENVVISHVELEGLEKAVPGSNYDDNTEMHYVSNDGVTTTVDGDRSGELDKNPSEFQPAKIGTAGSENVFIESINIFQYAQNKLNYMTLDRQLEIEADAGDWGTLDPTGYGMIEIPMKDLLLFDGVLANEFGGTSGGMTSYISGEFTIPNSGGEIAEITYFSAVPNISSVTLSVGASLVKTTDINVADFEGQMNVSEYPFQIILGYSSDTQNVFKIGFKDQEAWKKYYEIIKSGYGSNNRDDE
jgi:RHS repeat-associated protein